MACTLLVRHRMSSCSASSIGYDHHHRCAKKSLWDRFEIFVVEPQPKETSNGSPATPLIHASGPASPGGAAGAALRRPKAALREGARRTPRSHPGRRILRGDGKKEEIRWRAQSGGMVDCDWSFLGNHEWKMKMRNQEVKKVPLLVKKSSKCPGHPQFCTVFRGRNRSSIVRDLGSSPA